MTSNFYRINGYPVAPAVARDYLRMKADHDRETGGNMALYSGYRPRSSQVEIFERRYRPGAYSPWGDYRTYKGTTWGRIDPGGPAESPDANGGRGSNHTQGFALDFIIGRFYTHLDWMRKNAARYGFNNYEGQRVRENWHWCWNILILEGPNTPDPWEGRGRPDPVYSSDPGMTYAELMGGSSGSGGSTPAPNPNDNLLEAYDMIQIYQPTDGVWKGKHFALDKGYIKHIPTKESVQLFLDAHHTYGLKEIMVSDKTFRVLLGVNGVDSKVLDANGYVFDYRTTGKYLRGGSYLRGDDESAKTVYRIGKKVGA